MTPELRFCFLPDSDAEIALPTYESSGAAGADVRANFPQDSRQGVTLEPLERRLIPTGLAVEIPEGFEIQVRPRSGLALKHGIALVNAPGTIDSDYRGPVGVILVNLGAESVHIAHGDRIAQLVVSPVVRAELVAADSLSQTPRGSGGFGSTGQN
ncbi:MAG: dUTP diphosphatase [Boseongicola sp.]